MATKAGERLDKHSLLNVIELLEADKPITKKAACEMLNINYNTTRLKKLLNEFKELEESNKVMRKKNRGKPLSDRDLAYIAEAYLNGGTISGISEALFRSFNIIKQAVLSLNIPIKESGSNYFNPPLIPDEAISTDYNIDDLVYSSRYQCPAIIDKELKPHSEGKVYSIYLLGLEQCYASQPYWELADLTRVQKTLGIKIKAHSGVKASNNKPFTRG